MDMKILMGAASMAMIAWQPVHANDAKTSIMPEHPAARTFQEQVGFSDAVIAGDMIFLAGVVAGPMPGEEGLEPGFERAFARIAATLARAGASWDDVVDMTTYHTDLAGTINAFVAVKNRHVRAPFPAWTAIGISSLYEPTAVVEIKVTARKPEP